MVRFSTQIAVLGAVLALGIACSVDVNVADKACPCVGGYTCVDNVCLTPEEAARVMVLPDGGVVPSTCADPCPCTVDKDCTDPTRSKCSNKVCVECVSTPTDSCMGASYCNSDSHCTPGCKAEADCQMISPGTHCSLDLHQCVECVPTTFPCKDATKTCSKSGSCAVTCSAGMPCTGGGLCCQGLCLDTKSDVLNCGACDFACKVLNGTPGCVADKCDFSKCSTGFAHCQGQANTGCETNIRTDVNNCGGCGKTCSGVLHANGVSCNAGACTYTTCQNFFEDRDGNRANGCESPCGQSQQACCNSNPQCVPGESCNGGGNKCVP
jgi:hypothetical protein